MNSRIDVLPVEISPAITAEPADLAVAREVDSVIAADAQRDAACATAGS